MTFSVGRVVFQNGAVLTGGRRDDIPLNTLYDDHRIFLMIATEIRRSDMLVCILMECNFQTVKTQADFNEMIRNRKFVCIARQNEPLHAEVDGRTVHKTLLQGALTHFSNTPNYEASSIIGYFLLRGPNAANLNIKDTMVAGGADQFITYGRVWPALGASVESSGPAAPAAPAAPASADPSADPE